MADPPPYPDTGVGPDRGSTPGTPRWVTVSGMIVIVLALLVGGLMLVGGGLGGHGPGRHTPKGDTPGVEAPVLATIVLLLQIEPISYLAGVAAETTLSSADLREARMSLVVHAGGGLLVLLVPAALSVFKPRGRTRYGRRKQHEQRTAVLVP